MRKSPTQQIGWRLLLEGSSWAFTYETKDSFMMTMRSIWSKKHFAKRAAVSITLAGLGGLATGAGKTAWEWLLTLF
ncbi:MULTISPECIES: hypothetical protein [Streptomyces]|uniref:hypothetical protein n=1 Tax=Streptomyces TaxID=1883 RepID=UPI0004C7062B|nr:hypothetical protein [Streptomyces griseus]